LKLTVIIVNYNVQSYLEQCLNSVIEASLNNLTEIIVVDNNSADDSVKMLKEKFPQVYLIENEANKGFSVANNQAIKVAKGEYLLLLNPDTVVEEDTFEKIISFMDAHLDAGALGVKMLNGEGVFLPESKRGLPTLPVAFYKLSGLSKLFPTSQLFGKYHLGFLDENKTHQVDVLAGAFMLIRKSILDKVGLLDETFFMYGEDVDLSYRITLSGYKNYYFPETKIIHYKGKSTNKNDIDYVINFYKAMLIFAKKHFSKSNKILFFLFIYPGVYIQIVIAALPRLLRSNKP
jgi:GT2 family glycosyltransferase